MNKAKLKAYAPQARRDFIRMIRQRADLLGLTKSVIDQPQITGDIALIEGRPYPRRYAELHKRLAEKIKSEGLEAFIERIAYSWFNRLAALRFMEVNNLLSHGFRALSSRETGRDEPEILTHAAEIELPGLDKNAVIELKLAGNKDAELYRRLLIAQCNELHRAMPFLFEKINDETEILLPDNLLHSDSVIRKMVAGVTEEDWQEVEIIGWLYQFYISEKKDEVIGKTVRSEDIPAATQLFTPNWIVKYMTQNSLGRLWLENNPHSALAQNMEFYIKPAEESSKIQNPKSALSPEEIRVLDPACGSGHILVEAYELLKAIYTERGYGSRDIPLLILEKNLFGLDIDERAKQIASFALLMKARRDDRRIFEKINALNDGQIQNPKSKIPNVIAVPDSSHLKADEITEMFFSSEEQSGAAGVSIRDGSFLFSEMETQPSLKTTATDRSEIRNPKSKIEVSETNVSDLLGLFEQGKTLGSLIRIPPGIGAVVDELERAVEAKRENGNSLERIAARELEPFVHAAKMLANKYDCVIANPPYMGGKGMNAELKAFAAKNFPDSKSDLFAMFIERNFEFLKKHGFNAMVTMQSWMFLSSYQKMREKIVDEKTIVTMAHLGARAFVEISGEVVQTTTFVMKNEHLPERRPTFFRLVELSEAEKALALRNGENKFTRTHQDDFKKIPGSPIVYWVSDKVHNLFSENEPIDKFAKLREGIHTGNNELFLRLWHEVSFVKFSDKEESYDSIDENKKKWIPYNKGGTFRKWYGNNELVICFDEESRNEMGKLQFHVRPSQSLYFKEGGTWSALSSGNFGVRYYPKGFLFDSKGQVIVGDEALSCITLMNTNIFQQLAKMVMPTLDYKCGDVKKLPYLKIDRERNNEIREEAVSIARADWDSFETSWDFRRLPIVNCGLRNAANSVEECWKNWKNLCDERIERMRFLETENNRLFIEAYGLEAELSPEVPSEQITLARADSEKDTRRLLSYFLGCLMGRYSLDDEGLIYADAGNKGFDASRYQAFPADDDGIVPVTDMEWFPQEAAGQFEKFVRTVWGEAHSNQNLRWIAEQLGAKAGETPTETVRRYFSQTFFKDHLQTYKKRPIYWLFSSGKQKAFECLVYLHRYSEATLARMRHEYVLPLMSKLSATIDIREAEIDKAESTSEKSKLARQKEILVKKQTELAAFDEKLRHLADRKISLDLDDGVKVNYGKFGDLLAEVKQVAATRE